MWHNGFGYGYGAMGFGWLFGLLAVVVIALVMMYLVRAFGGRPSSRGASPPRSLEDPALRILRERYARGEIDREEFDERRRGLM